MGAAFSSLARASETDLRRCAQPGEQGDFMRLLMSGLLGLCLWAMLAPAEATTRSDARPSASSGSRAGSSAAARPAEARPKNSAAARSQAASRPTARSATAGRANAGRATAGRATAARAPAAVPYSRQQAAAPQRDLRQTAMATCTMRNGRRVCVPATRSASLRWTGGLAPAGMSQASCPDGTMATMAFGHHDVVRCVPL